jgi:hydrogenase-4 component F
MVQRDFSTTTLGKLRGLWQRGGSGRLLLAAFVALSGMPPFGLFVSELLLVFAGIAAHQWVPLGLGLTGIALAFAAVARNAIEIESGAAKAPGIESSPALTTPRTFEQRIAARLAAVASGTIAVALIGALSIAVVPWTSLGTSLQRIAATLESAP